MARSAIAETVLNTRVGLSYPPSETAGDNTNGHFFVWGPNKILSVRNATGGTLAIVFTPQSTGLDVFAAPPKAINVAANSQNVFGPFPSIYMHPEDNDRMYVDVGGVLQLAVLNSAEA
jgi:hypothetical protein